MLALWIAGTWFAGAVLIGATVLRAGGEHPLEWRWFLFSLAIWPLWAVTIAIAIIAKHIEQYS